MSDLGQTLFVMTFFTIIVLTMVFSTYIYQQIQGPLNNSTFSTNESISAYNRFEAAWPLFDRASLFILVAMICGVLISAFLIPTHPVYVIGNMFIMGIEIFVSFVISNAYFGITAQNADLATIAATTYPLSSHIIQYLPRYALALSTLNCIIMFSHGFRNRSQGVYG